MYMISLEARRGILKYLYPAKHNKNIFLALLQLQLTYWIFLILKYYINAVFLSKKTELEVVQTI